MLLARLTSVKINRRNHKTMAEKYFSTTEVAAILGISRIAVFKKIKAGKLKAMKVGRSLVIEKKDFLDLYRAKLAKERKKESSTD